MAELSSLGRAALAYAEHGWFVLPLEPRGKWPWTGHPAFQAPKGEGGFKLATRNLEHLRAAWAVEPRCNVGMWPGPSGLLVIDSDGDPGENTLAPLGLDRLPTLMSRTGRPECGFHRFYRSPGAGIEGDLGADTTVRHHGGFIVLPPSIHPSGRAYRWLNRSTPIAPCPQPVLARLTPHSTGDEGCGPAPVVLGDILAGARDVTLASFAGSMRRRGMSEPAILAALRVENAARCRPPLPDSAIERIAGSIGRYPPAPASNPVRRSTPYTYTPSSR